MLKLDKLDI